MENWKENIIKAYSEGKIIQSNHHTGDWNDFVPQNQVDRPNLDYGDKDNWRIKPEESWDFMSAEKIIQEQKNKQNITKSDKGYGALFD